MNQNFRPALAAVALGLAIFGSVIVNAAPGDMSVATFLEKADKLKSRGPLALLSGDMKVLRREGEASGKAYRARIAADKKAGRTPHSCPPEKISMDSDQMLAHLRTYPTSRRGSVSMRQAFADLMKKRYPCS